jgi:hypothetical protein
MKGFDEQTLTKTISEPYDEFDVTIENALTSKLIDFIVCLMPQIKRLLKNIIKIWHYM